MMDKRESSDMGEDEGTKQILVVTGYPLVDNSSTLITTTTTAIPESNGNKTTGGTYFLSSDTTKILIVFLVVVFLILIAFLLLYHFVIKRMRQRSISKLTLKSASGSLADEKARNIFAHPERQLAVDQSTRMNSASPTTPSEASSEPQNQQSGTKQQQSNAPSGNGARESQLTRSPKSKERIEPESSRKSGSSGKNRSKSDRQVNTTTNQHSIMGALAGIRDTLKETEAKK